MSLSHVAVTGRDRRHLSLLGTSSGSWSPAIGRRSSGIVVDAYVPASKVAWLRKQGYGVKVLEEVEAPDRARQAEERSAAAVRLKRGRYGDVIWGGGYLHRRRSRAGHRARGPESRQLLRAHSAAQPHLGKATVPRVPDRQPAAARRGPRSASSRGCTAGSGAAPIFSSTSRCACCAPTATGRASGWAAVSSRAAQVRAIVETLDIVVLPAGESRWPALQHGPAPDVAEEPAAGATRPRATSPSAWTSTGTSRSCGTSIGTSLPAPWESSRTRVTTRPTSARARPPSPKPGT